MLEQFNRSRGGVSLFVGPALIVAGLVAGIHLMALAGVAVLGWGIFRFIARRTAR